MKRPSHTEILLCTWGFMKLYLLLCNVSEDILNLSTPWKTSTSWYWYYAQSVIKFSKQNMHRIIIFTKHTLMCPSTTQTGRKSVVCDVCGKAFQVHIIWRSIVEFIQEGNHTSVQCGRTFVDASALKKHMQLNSQFSPICWKQLWSITLAKYGSVASLTMIALLLETENNVYILSCTDLICLLKTSFDCCLVTTIKTIMCFTLVCRFNMALQTSFDCYLVTTIRTRMCLPSCTYFTCFFKLSFVEYLIEIPGTWHF